MSREHRAEAVSVRALLHPRSVAVIGASRRTDTVGNTVLNRLLAEGFAGSIYPVNPNAESIADHHAYPSVSAIPEPVDLAIVTVPAHAVLEVVDECAAAEVKALLVMSSGFAEAGKEGARRQAELVRRHHFARAYLSVL